MPRSESRAPSVLDQEPDECGRVYAALAEKLISQLPPAPSVIAFTSPTHFAGQTEMLVRLATALVSRVQGNVMLVDANVDRWSLDRFPGIEVQWENGAGCWPAPVYPTSHEGLSVMPFGPSARNNGGSPQGGTQSELMDRLRSHCRLAVLSAPPLCQEDAIWMARHCDGACLVVELGRTPRRAAERAVGTLDTAGVRLLGCVVAEGQPE
jgi:Mrp family chromosome partitioning ATPase